MQQNKSMTFVDAMREYFEVDSKGMREAGFLQLTPADKAEYSVMLREAGYTLTDIEKIAA